MGNICRSPSAEGVFRHVLASQAPDLQIEIDSAGTHDYHVRRRRRIAAPSRQPSAAASICHNCARAWSRLKISRTTI